MTERELRALLRKEIKSQINEADTDFLHTIGTNLRSKLGSGKTQLSAGLSKLDSETISKMSPEQKAELVAKLSQQLGLTAKDFTVIKQRVARKLGASEKAAAVATAPVTEDLSSDLQSKSLKATQTNAFKILVKTLDVKNADQQAEFILDMLKGLKLKPNALMKVKRNLSDLNEASIPADLYVNAPVAIGAILAVLTGVGLLARHEIKKAQKEIQTQMDVAVTDADIKKGESAISESKRRK